MTDDLTELTLDDLNGVAELAYHDAADVEIVEPGVHDDADALHGVNTDDEITGGE